MEKDKNVEAVSWDEPITSLRKRVVYATPAPYEDQVVTLGIWVGRQSSDGFEIFAAKDIKMERIGIADGRENMIPTAMRLSKQEATGLMNSLWHAGIRPQNLRDEEATTDATQGHLNDMKKLVFNYLMPALTQNKECDGKG